MSLPLFVLLPAMLLVFSGAAAVPQSYVPHPGDKFVYAETIEISSGTGNYSGYTETDDYTGSIAVTAVAANLTISASYEASGRWSNNQGKSGPWSESGTFSFSASTYHYVQGTDNQSGYVNPYTWFFMDNSLTQGQSFYLLNTPMNVVSTNYSFPMSSSSTGYVKTIFAEGNGSYVRNDPYGVFNANYNWKEYFDPSTGYVVGYLYTEQDSNAQGDGFTYTDTLTDSSTTFTLAPTSPGTVTTNQSQGSSSDWLFIVAVIIVLAVVIIVVIAVLLRRRSSQSTSTPSQPKMDRDIPRHSHAEVPSTIPTYGSPSPVRLIPSDQPAVQQIIIRETVKVPCSFCGTLIDSTDTSCPKCGAPRT